MSPKRRALLFFVRDERREVSLKPLPTPGADYRALNRRVIELLGSVDADLIVVGESRAQAGVNGIVQRGSTFGERIVGAIDGAFSRGYERVVVVGNDCPALTGPDIEKAFDRLDTATVVAAPTTDGGAYLIGFSSDDFVPGALISLPWCTSRLYQSLISLPGATGMGIVKDDFDDWCSRAGRLALINFLRHFVRIGKPRLTPFFYFSPLRKSYLRFSSPAP